jgi:hypothetical protein
VRGRPLRRWAATVLGKVGSDHAVEPLIAALNDKDDVVHEDAAKSLEKMVDSRVVEPLKNIESVCWVEKEIHSEMKSRNTERKEMLLDKSTFSKTKIWIMKWKII